MRILVVGGGGREHALCWAISASPLCTKLYCAPGNAGIAQVAECIDDVGAEDIPGQVALARRLKIDFVVIAPDAPLVAGMADAFAEAGIKAWGPSKAAARLEGSKSFTKELCRANNIPTAAYERFTEVAPAEAYIRSQGVPIVIKADGLAAGKGVIIAETVDQAIEAVRGSAVTLDIYGTSVESARLAELAQTTGGLVQLRGHDQKARSRLADHGFLLLASVSEGLPLVLTEAMAAGCIPVAYDVPYGPADIITDRVDGVLVKSGDTAGLRDAIAWLGERSARELRTMRRAARLAAEQYGSEAVTRRWLTELIAAWNEKVLSKPRRSLVTRARAKVRRTVRPLVARVRASH